MYLSSFCIGFSGIVIFSLLCGFYGTTPLRAITFLTLAAGFESLNSAGFYINHLDIAPQYSAILIGISSTVAALPGFVAISAAKALTHEVRIYVLHIMHVMIQLMQFMHAHTHTCNKATISLRKSCLLCCFPREMVECLYHHCWGVCVWHHCLWAVWIWHWARLG